ncbi:MAG: hypothetical protein DI535_17805 [Citrobacter freundii]|nr:MAG: hypothetical protein DI535_17805 [Citrobacter freundii]
MSSPSLYQKILRNWKSFQFEVVSFGLIVLGVWLIWRLLKRPFVPDWVIYVVVMWAIALILHIWRIIYLIKRIKKD